MSKSKHSNEPTNLRQNHDGLKIHDQNPDFRLWIGVLLFAADETVPQIAETLKHYTSSLHECVASGIRRRFFSIKKSDLVQWATDKSDQSLICLEAKAYLSSNPRGTELPDTLLLKILSEYIGKLQPDHGEIRNSSRLLTTDSVAGDMSAMNNKNLRVDKKAIDTKERPNSKKAKDSARSQTLGAHPFPTLNPTKAKLRDRQVNKLKVICLDDEPVDGPDFYIILQQFHSLSFLQLLLETDFVPVHSVTALYEMPSITNSLDAFKFLKSKAMAAAGGTHTLFTQLSYPKQLGPTALFDAIAFHYYALCNDEQAYEHYYAKRLPIRIPSAQIPDAESLLNDKSVERELLNELVNYLSTFEQRLIKSVFNAAASEEKKSTFKPRLNVLLKRCAAGTEPCQEWKREIFAKVSNITPAIAEFYMDLYHFELLLGRPLESFDCVERVSDETLLERVGFILESNPKARSRIQNRGNKLLLAINSAEGVPCHQSYPLIPIKLSFGEWYDLKIHGTLDLDMTEAVYNSDLDLINHLQRVPLCNGTFTIDQPTLMEKQNFCTISNPHIVCTVYPNRFFASFPYSGSKLLIQLPPTSSSATPTQDCKVIYSTSNGWLCYRSTEKGKGKENEDSFYIQSTPKETKSKGHPAASTHWRKIYQNGDQWVQNEHEIYFYGHDGKRGFRVLQANAPSTWTWTSPSGQVWQNGEPTTQLKRCKQIDPKNGVLQWWSEDDVTLTVSPEGDTKVKYPDGTTILQRVNGSIYTKIPNIGELKIFHDDYLFTEVCGAQIQFSNELTMILPQDFLLCTTYRFSKIFFSGYTVDLKESKVIAPQAGSKPLFLAEEPQKTGSPSPLKDSSDYLFVLQKSPLPSYMFYDAFKIDILTKLVLRSIHIQAYLMKSPLADNLESLTMVVTSTRKKRGIRQFLKFPPIAHSTRSLLKEFFKLPPELPSEPCGDAHEPGNLLTCFKTRTRDSKSEPRATLVGELLKSPDFRKIHQRKQIPAVPFQPYLNPEFKKCKFVPVPYFKSEHGLRALKYMNKVPYVFLSRPHSNRRPQSFDYSNFAVTLDSKQPSSSTSIYALSPKLVPKENKAFRLRQSRTMLNESLSTIPTTRITHI